MKCKIFIPFTKYSLSRLISKNINNSIHCAYYDHKIGGFVITNGDILVVITPKIPFQNLDFSLSIPTCILPDVSNRRTMIEEVNDKHIRFTYASKYGEFLSDEQEYAYDLTSQYNKPFPDWRSVIPGDKALSDQRLILDSSRMSILSTLINSVCIKRPHTRFPVIIENYGYGNIIKFKVDTSQSYYKLKYQFDICGLISPVKAFENDKLINIPI